MTSAKIAAILMVLCWSVAGASGRRYVCDDEQVLAKLDQIVSSLEGVGEGARFCQQAPRGGKRMQTPGKKKQEIAAVKPPADGSKPPLDRTAPSGGGDKKKAKVSNLRANNGDESQLETLMLRVNEMERKLPAHLVVKRHR